LRTVETSSIRTWCCSMAKYGDVSYTCRRTTAYASSC